MPYQLASTAETDFGHAGQSGDLSLRAALSESDTEADVEAIGTLHCARDGQ
jgi:hypothetical protein